MDCTKRFFETCKKINYATPEKLKAYYKLGKIRIIDFPCKKRCETEIGINLTRAKVKKSTDKNYGFKTRSIPYHEFEKSLQQMGIYSYSEIVS